MSTFKKLWALSLAIVMILTSSLALAQHAEHKQTAERAGVVNQHNMTDSSTNTPNEQTPPPPPPGPAPAPVPAPAPGPAPTPQ